MRVELALRATPPRRLVERARLAEAAGFDSLSVNETAHDSIVGASALAMATERCGITTAVTIALPRSPTTVAMAAWDIQALSQGRFSLGLGSQVRAHIQRRFGAVWTQPVVQMRDYVGALRAIWRSFQNGDPLRYESEHYRLSLLTREFNPGPIPWPDIPIQLAGINRAMCRLAGEVADTFRTHLIATPEYLRQIARPALAEGAARAGRDPASIPILATAFQALGDSEEEVEVARTEARRQIGFYLSTPSYRPVLSVHGLDDLGESLSRLATAGRWDELATAVPDDALETFAICGRTQDLARLVKARYGDLIDGYVLGALPSQVADDADRLSELGQAFRDE